jgi:hypothetical protein
MKPDAAKPRLGVRTDIREMQVPHFLRVLCVRKPALSEVEGWGCSSESNGVSSVFNSFWIITITYRLFQSLARILRLEAI